MVVSKELAEKFERINQLREKFNMTDDRLLPIKGELPFTAYNFIGFIGLEKYPVFDISAYIHHYMERSLINYARMYNLDLDENHIHFSLKKLAEKINVKDINIFDAMVKIIDHIKENNLTIAYYNFKYNQIGSVTIEDGTTLDDIINSIIVEELQTYRIKINSRIAKILGFSFIPEMIYVDLEKPEIKSYEGDDISKELRLVRVLKEYFDNIFLEETKLDVIYNHDEFLTKATLYLENNKYVKEYLATNKANMDIKTILINYIYIYNSLKNNEETKFSSNLGSIIIDIRQYPYHLETKIALAFKLYEKKFKFIKTRIVDDKFEPLMNETRYKFVNLIDKDISLIENNVVVFKKFKKNPHPPMVDYTYISGLLEFDGVPLSKRIPTIYNMPEPEHGTMYIVSKEIFNVLSDKRTDIVTPDMPTILDGKVYYTKLIMPTGSNIVRATKRNNY